MSTQAVQPGQTAELPCSDRAGWGNPAYYRTIHCADVDGDGKAELLARGAAGIEVCKWDKNLGWVFWQSGPALSDTSGWNQPQYYETIQAADIDGDKRAEIIGRGAGGIVVWKLDRTSAWIEAPAGPALSDASGWNQVQYYQTIQAADIDGDGQAELFGRGAGGIAVWKFDNNRHAWVTIAPGPPFSDAGGWNQPQYYETIQAADVDGDRQAEVLARGAGGIVVWKLDKKTNAWVEMNPGPAFSDAAGWNQPQYYKTIQTGDVDGDGRAEIIGRGAGGIVVWKLDSRTNAWVTLPNGPPLSDAAGWADPQYYGTIHAADIDGDGQAEIVARGAAGILAWKCDRTNNQWIQLGAAPALPESADWGDPKYNATVQWADVDGDGRKELVMRGPQGIVSRGLDSLRGNRWTKLPRKGPIPVSNSGNIQNARDNLLKMDQLTDQIHDACQDKIIELQAIAEIDTKTFQDKAIIFIVSNGFKGAFTLAGASAVGTVLAGALNYAVDHVPGGDPAAQYADTWSKFSACFLALKKQIATFRSQTLQNWNTAFSTGEDLMVVGDLATEHFPEAATLPFNDLLNAGVEGFRYSLWRSSLQQRWQITAVTKRALNSKQECIDFLNNTVDNVSTFVVGCGNRPAGIAQNWWIDFRTLHRGLSAPSDEMCKVLFRDDAFGNTTNPAAITTRADVYNNWNIPAAKTVLI